MFHQIVRDYRLVVDLASTTHLPLGSSAAPKSMIFHVLDDNSQAVDVLDIGLGTGSLASLIKSNEGTQHWQVDGIDGWEANCYNAQLIEKKLYRNIWCGLAQDLTAEQLSRYRFICLLDVIEHVDVNTAKWLLRTLLSYMDDSAYLFISTPLWFYPQSHQESGDLEEHLIGVPASSMFALIPVMYAINNPLIGGFIYSKKSLAYVDFFQPTSNKNFSYQMGLNILRTTNINYQPGVLYKYQGL